jgi:hypothetical protein
MLTRSAIALASVVLMLTTAAWESSITRHPTAFNQLWENIRHIDYPGAFNQLWENIRRIDANAVSAAATVAIAVFSLTLWLVNRRQGSDARVIQRAYVRISHSPPVQENPVCFEFFPGAPSPGETSCPGKVAQTRSVRQPTSSRR